jgi:hypothetical protein
VKYCNIIRPTFGGNFEQVDRLKRHGSDQNKCD